MSDYYRYFFEFSNLESNIQEKLNMIHGFIQGVLKRIILQYRVNNIAPQNS